MPVPIWAALAAPALLYGLQRGYNGLFNPEETPAPGGPRPPNVAQQSIQVADRGVQYNQPSLPAQAAAPRTAPVATPGEAAAPAPADAANEDAMERLRALQANNPQAAEPTDDPEADRNRRIAQFGFAMAASRNPSLFGMIGEAGLAMQRGNREEREDDRRDREVDANAEYRRAQIQLARAEALYNQDPNNPRNIALLAQARYAATRAANVGSGGGGGDRISGQVVGDDGVVYGMTRDGRVVPYTTPDGSPFRRGQTENWQAQWMSAYTGALRDLSALGQPTATMPEEERRNLATARANAAIAAMRNALSRPGQPAQTQGTAATPEPYRTLQVR